MRASFHVDPRRGYQQRGPATLFLAGHFGMHGQPLNRFAGLERLPGGLPQRDTADNRGQNRSHGYHRAHERSRTNRRWLFPHNSASLRPAKRAAAWLTRTMRAWSSSRQIMSGA